MSFLTNIILKGKSGKGNIRLQRIINITMMIGIILLWIWALVLLPDTFINKRIVFTMFFLPGMLLTPFLYKTYITGCGYELPGKRGMSYRIVILIAVYMLITIPAGGLITTTFLFANYFFDDIYENAVELPLQNVAITNSHGRSYLHFDVIYDGIRKQINAGDRAVYGISGKHLHAHLHRGLFGYYILKKYTIE